MSPERAVTMAEKEGTAPDGVVLLHGFGGLPVQTALLARRLGQTGFAVANVGYPSWRWPLDRVADHVERRIRHSPVATAPTLHFVGHSMGGLVLRTLITRHRPSNLGRVVMLGTPNGGSELADLLYRLRLHPLILNRAAPALRTRRDTMVETALGQVNYPLGVIAGDRPIMQPFPGLSFARPMTARSVLPRLIARTKAIIWSWPWPIRR